MDIQKEADAIEQKWRMALIDIAPACSKIIDILKQAFEQENQNEAE